MTRVLVLIASVISIGCVTIAKERAPASANSDFTKEYQQKLRSAEKQEVLENDAEWEAHKEYLREVDRGNRF